MVLPRAPWWEGLLLGCKGPVPMLGSSGPYLYTGQTCFSCSDHLKLIPRKPALGFFCGSGGFQKQRGVWCTGFGRVLKV